MSEPRLDVLLHEDMSSSRLIHSLKSAQEVEHVVKSEVHRVLDLPGSPWSYTSPAALSQAHASLRVDTTRGTHLVLPEESAYMCAAQELSPGMATSAVLSLVEYGPTTRCHLSEPMDTMHATLFWLNAVRFVGAHPLAGLASSRPPRRAVGHCASPLSGVFLMCLGVDRFVLGLITSGSPRSTAVRKLCLEFTQSVGKGKPFATMFTSLPIGAPLRCVSLAFWWTPQRARVVPGVPLPCIKLIVKEYGQRTDDTQIRCDVFKGYQEARVFLLRPFDSSLSGTRVCAVPHDPMAMSDRRALANASATASERQNTAASFVDAPPLHETTQPYTDEGVAVPSPGLSTFFAVGGAERAVAHILFTDVCVSQTGEHLVGLELTVHEAFRAFVPVLCTHLSPFLVVGTPGA